LWEQWAKAAGAIAVNLFDADPLAARNLLDEIWRVAETRNEPGLIEWCVVTTFVLAANTRERDPDETAKLLERLNAVPPEIVERAKRRLNPKGARP
jgi:hypothetical protein